MLFIGTSDYEKFQELLYKKCGLKDEVKVVIQKSEVNPINLV
jgi:hypothetical protein